MFGTLAITVPPGRSRSTICAEQPLGSTDVLEHVGGDDHVEAVADVVGQAAVEVGADEPVHPRSTPSGGQRVDAGDLVAEPRQRAGEVAGPAADVEDPPRRPAVEHRQHLRRASCAAIGLNAYSLVDPGQLAGAEPVWPRAGSAPTSRDDVAGVARAR